MLLPIAKIDMRSFLSLAAFLMVASTAGAQDTTVVVVRHLAAQQDTSVTVRHLAPAPRPQAAAPGYAAPYGAPRYALRSNGVIAKDPNVATSLSLFFPGGGQYYADATGKGLAITAIAIGAPIIGYQNVNRVDNNDCVANQNGAQFGGQFCRGHYDYTSAAIGLGVGITAWLYGIATAGRDAQRWNQAHGVRFVTAPGRVGFAVAVP
jgi:hypothetical protein